MFREEEEEEEEEVDLSNGALPWMVDSSKKGSSTIKMRRPSMITPTFSS
jgi:hypothetical protein